jgi:hypothetical protein
VVEGVVVGGGGSGEDADVVAFFEEAVDEVAADEAGGAGDEGFHNVVGISVGGLKSFGFFPWDGGKA